MKNMILCVSNLFASYTKLTPKFFARIDFENYQLLLLLFK
jgi:hypothetical protein